MANSACPPQRDRANQIHPSPRTGQPSFLTSGLRQLPCFDRVLARLRAGDTFLDVGCGLGQEARYLAHLDDISSEQLYGLDLHQSLVDLGYELFRDYENLASVFTSGDLIARRTSPQGEPLNLFEEACNVIYLGELLDKWDHDNQILAARRLVSFSKPGSVIIGTNSASLLPGTYPKANGNGSIFRHDMDSFRRFWARIGKDTYTLWEVEGDMQEPCEENRDPAALNNDPGLRYMWFCVTRIDDHGST